MSYNAAILTCGSAVFGRSFRDAGDPSLRHSTILPSMLPAAGGKLKRDEMCSAGPSRLPRSTDHRRRTTMQRMRGDHREPDSMFSYVSPEQRIPKEHPLRVIRALVDDLLG